MQIQHRAHAVFLAKRQRRIQLAQGTFEPRVILGCRLDLHRRPGADDLPADQVGVPFLAKHTQAFRRDVGRDHRAAQTRFFMTCERWPSGRICGSRAWTVRHNDLDVVKLGAPTDRFETKDQLRSRCIRWNDSVELDTLPIERPEQVVMLGPNWAAGRGDVHHELDAVPGLRRLGHAIAFDHRATSKPSAANFVDRQRNSHFGGDRGVRQLFHLERLRALESGSQPHVLISLSAPRAQRARAFETRLENNVASLWLRKTGRSNHPKDAGSPDSLMVPTDKKTAKWRTHILDSVEVSPAFQTIFLGRERIWSVTANDCAMVQNPFPAVRPARPAWWRWGFELSKSSRQMR